MEFQYAKDNMERMPYAFYMENYQQADPAEISTRLRIPYDFEKKEFTVLFMNTVYHISYPDLIVTHEENEMCFYPLEENIHAKILVLRYLLNASVLSHNGNFRAYRELPSGDLYYRQFQGRCIFRLSRKYGNRLEIMEKIMRHLNAVSVEAAADTDFKCSGIAAQDKDTG